MGNHTALSYYGIIDGPSLDTIIARFRLLRLAKEPYFVCQPAVLVDADSLGQSAVAIRYEAPKMKFDLLAVRSISRPDASNPGALNIECLTGFDWQIWRTLSFLPDDRSGHFAVPVDSDPHFRLESSRSS